MVLLLPMSDTKSKQPPEKINIDPAPKPESQPEQPNPKAGLVNEIPPNPGGGEPAETVTSQLESYKRANERLRLKLEVAEAKVARNHSSPEAMRFRIFLEIVAGFSAGGKLDMQTLAQKPGSEKNIFKHAAGLAELAYAEVENRPTFGLA